MCGQLRGLIVACTDEAQSFQAFQGPWKEIPQGCLYPSDQPAFGPVTEAKPFLGP